jgi:hypothetical protein
MEITFLPVGSGLPASGKNSVTPLITSYDMTEACFSRGISPGTLWSADGQTVVADNAIADGNLKMATLFDDLNGRDLKCHLIMAVGDPYNPGSSTPEYYPIIDSIHLKVTTV